MVASSYLTWLALPLSIVAAKDGILPGFDKPENDQKATFRYWYPDATVEIDQVVRDIEAIGEVGAGGIQMNHFYNFGLGDPRFPPVTQWDEYGFATDAFKKVFDAALDAANTEGLNFEFGIGANQGQGVPSKPLTEGLAVHLVLGETTVNGGEEFEGRIPEPDLNFNFNQSALFNMMNPLEEFGPSRLLGVVAGGIKSVTKPDDTGHVETLIDENSLVDLSDDVSNGFLSWKAPSDYDEYALIAIYERYTNQRSCAAPLNTTTVIANGSWVTDHFSAKGAELVINLWENEILTDQSKEMLKSVGKHTWEDSMEILSGVFWGTGLLERWKENREYDPIKYLPFLFHRSNSYRMEFSPYQQTFVLGDANSAENKYLQDYRLTLSEGYAEYIEAYEEWSQSLGLTHSAQVSYHLPLDMSSHVPLSGRPELESLAFPEIDHLLQFMGPAHLSGTNVVSSELGAEITGAYSLAVPGLLELFNEGFAAGVNMMVIHGYAYSGEYMSTWPGYTPAGFITSEIFNPHVPVWSYINETLAYVARNQHVLQTGVPKRDVAFYLWKAPWHDHDEYEGDDLNTAGYTYDYLGPDNLVSDHATVVDKMLAPDGPAYKALVFNGQQFISPEAARKAVQFAKAGLPIIVTGQLPNETIGTNGIEDVRESMNELKEYDNVAFVGDSETLAEKLASEGVTPRVFVRSGSGAEDLWSFWRSVEDGDYIFFYNAGKSETFGLTFDVETNQVPYILDAWTGEQRPQPLYDRSDDGVVLSLNLKKGQTAIVGFAPSQQQSEVCVKARSMNVESVHAGSDDKFVALIDDLENAYITLCDDSVVELLCDFDADKMPEVKLGSWDLTLESWVPSEDSDRSAVETHRLGPLEELVPWIDLPGMANVSGVGIYETTLTLPDGWNFDAESSALYVHFGKVYNSIRVWVNDQMLPALDITDAEAEIAKFLVQGDNTIRIETSSTLFNAVKARADEVESVGTGPIAPEAYEDVEYQPFGLVGPVKTRLLRKMYV